MKYDNLLIVKTETGGLTLHLSDYAAWALLRRLQTTEPSDTTEATFVDDAVKRLEQSLTE